MYYFEIKGPNPLNSKKRERRATNITQTKLVPLIKQLKQTQHLVIILIFGLEQLALILRGVHVQQIMATILPINILIANGLLVHCNDVLFQQAKWINL
jgi:hypothetical protein